MRAVSDGFPVTIVRLSSKRTLERKDEVVILINMGKSFRTSSEVFDLLS